MCVNYHVYLSPVFCIPFRLVYLLFPVCLPCPVLPLMLSVKTIILKYLLVCVFLVSPCCVHRNTGKVTIVTFKKKIKICQITWMSPILSVKLMKWSLNRINYYYKTLYTNLHYFNVSVGQCERHLSNSIDYCKYYQPSIDTLAIESALACHFF